MGKHGVVVILVVKLQDLNKVVETSLVLAVLAGLVHGEDIVLGQHLLSLGLGSSDLSDGLEGGVQVAGSDEVTSVEGINLAISLEVIDIEGEVDGVNLLLLESKILQLKSLEWTYFCVGTIKVANKVHGNRERENWMNFDLVHKRTSTRTSSTKERL